MQPACKGQRRARNQRPEANFGQIARSQVRERRHEQEPDAGHVHVHDVGRNLYNFNNKTTNPQTNTSREYSLPFDYTTMVGYELAFRLGKDKEDDHDSKTGFHYYRSNRGIFTDFELGLKTQRYEDKPSRVYL
jgi:hypothetical protein